MIKPTINYLVREYMDIPPDERPREIVKVYQDELQLRGERCAHCGKPLQQGEQVVGLIVKKVIESVIDGKLVPVLEGCQFVPLCLACGEVN